MTEHPAAPTMTEVLHCAGCHGADYLGRKCRGRSCSPARAASQERPSIDVERLAEGLDVETLARATHDAWPKPGCTASIHDHNWGADSFYGSFAAAILARLSERRDKEGTE